MLFTLKKYIGGTMLPLPLLLLIIALGLGLVWFSRFQKSGKTLITFFFDSCYTWLINFPIAFVLSRYTALPLPIVYLFVNGVDLLKCIIGFILVKKGVWVNNIVASSQDVPQAD